MNRRELLASLFGAAPLLAVPSTKFIFDLGAKKYNDEAHIMWLLRQRINAAQATFMERFNINYFSDGLGFPASVEIMPAFEYEWKQISTPVVINGRQIAERNKQLGIIDLLEDDN